MLSTKNKIYGLTALLIVLSGIFYFIKISPKDIGEGAEKVGETPDYTIEVIPLGSNASNVVAPDLDRKTGFEVADEKSKSEIEKLSKTLKASPQDVLQWVDLGSWRKAIGDYEGAVIVWEYVTKIAPGYGVPYINLGNIYHYYLKDYVKAEINFKKFISMQPTYIDGYQRLFNLYSQSYLQNTTKAADILKEGILKNPNAAELYIDLALYYKEKGDTDNFKKTLNEVKIIAERALNNDLVSEIDKMLISN